MKSINFLLQGFGFDSWLDFKASSFGFITLKTGVFASAFAMLTSVSEYLFGFKLMFLIAFSVLIIFEWSTGILASKARGEKHESRKLGRMILKIGIYTILLFVLNTFSRTSSFPVLMGYELDPFIWLYWVVLLIIIWQLIVSLMENLNDLGFRWAKMALKVINKNFYEKLNIDEKDNSKA